MNFPFLLREAVGTVKKRPILSVVFCCIFVIGILVGGFFDKPASVRSYYLDYCDNYVYRVFTDAPVKLLLDRLLASLVFLLLSIPTALSVFFLPLEFFLVFFKGFVFGSVTAILFSVYRFSGFMIWLVVLAPQAILFSVVCMLLFLLAFDFAIENRGRIVNCFRNFAAYLFTAFFAAVLCSLLEFFVLFFVFRPLSKVL